MQSGLSLPRIQDKFIVLKKEKAEFVDSTLTDSFRRKNSGMSFTLSESRNNPQEGSAVTERFIKYKPTDEAEYLALNYPNAFILLTLIANRVRREAGKPDGLRVGECFFDYKDTAFSRKQFRTALDWLIKLKHVEKVETSKSKNNLNPKTEEQERAKNGAKERAKPRAKEGTILKILSLSIYDLNLEDEGQRSAKERAKDGAKVSQYNDFPQGSSPPSSFSLPPSPLETPPPISISLSPSSPNPKNEKKEHSGIHTCKTARCIPKDPLGFSYENYKFYGITADDRNEWKEAFPTIAIDQEIAKAEIWVRNAGNRGKKKLWRKFLSSWLSRAETMAFNNLARNSQKCFQPQQDKYQKIISTLIHGQVYNGFECCKTTSGISFSRGNCQYQATFKEPNFKLSLEVMLQKVGINLDE